VVVRAISEELSLDTERLKKEGILHHRLDTYNFEIEQIDSPSYPGLTSMYRTHHVQVDILAPGLELFEGRGLPHCGDFCTEEQTKLGSITNYWKWYDIGAALQSNVVKFPPQVLSSNTLTYQQDDSQETAGGCAGAKTLTATELPDPVALTAYMARAGIDPSRYGVDKAKPVSAC